MTDTADIMVLTPHPDDAEFGVGGTVARWTRAGKQVLYIVCTNGDKGTTERAMQPQHLIKIREEEQKAAATILGVREVVFLGYPDQGLEDTPAFRKQIVRLIRMYQPATIATSDPCRRYLLHRDHRITGQVTLDAVFPYARDHLAYPDLIDEGLQPHKVHEILLWETDAINYRSDITETFHVKLAALRCHASQVKEFGIADLENWLRRHCRKMSAGENFELAEAFHRVEIPW